MRTNGEFVNTVQVECRWCGSRHWHSWLNEVDALRLPPCQAGGAAYRVTVSTQERVEAMRSHYPAPNGVVGLNPLHINYAFEVDGDDDVVGVVIDTVMGGFCLWLAINDAITLAGQLVEIADRRDELREAYAALRGATASA